MLLLHGYSDSPYSLRSIGETLRAQGETVYRIGAIAPQGQGAPVEIR